MLLLHLFQQCSAQVKLFWNFEPQLLHYFHEAIIPSNLLLPTILPINLWPNSKLRLTFPSPKFLVLIKSLTNFGQKQLIFPLKKC